MLRKFKLGGVILGALLALVGCQSEKLVNDGGSQQGQQFTLTASKGMGGSRTAIINGQTVWSEGDKIYVSSKNGDVTGVLTLTSEPGEPTGTFSGFVFGNPDKLAYSVFPAPTDGTVIDLSTIVGGGEVDAPMIGAIVLNPIDGTDVHFENVCGVAPIVMNGYQDEKLEIKATNNDFPVKFLSKLDVTKVNLDSNPLSFIIGTDETETITINAPKGGQMYVPYFLKSELVDNNEGKKIVEFKQNDKSLNKADLSNGFVGKVHSTTVVPYTFDENGNGVKNETTTPELKTDEGGQSTAVVNKEEFNSINSNKETPGETQYFNVSALVTKVEEGKTETVVAEAIEVTLPKVAPATESEQAVEKSVEISFTNVTSSTTITVKEEASESTDSKSIDNLTVVLPSGTTKEEAKEQVVIEMPNTTVTVKSADGNMLLINEAVATTGENTFIISEDVVINGLWVCKGNVDVYGTVKNWIKRHEKNSDDVTTITLYGNATVGNLQELEKDSKFIVKRGGAEEPEVPEGGDMELSDFVAALEDPDVIEVVLANDIELKGPVSIAEGERKIIDLNGYTISLSEDFEWGSSTAAITNNGCSWEIKNGNIEGTTTSTNKWLIKSSKRCDMVNITLNAMGVLNVINVENSDITIDGSEITCNLDENCYALKLLSQDAYFIAQVGRKSDVDLTGHVGITQNCSSDEGMGHSILSVRYGSVKGNLYIDGTYAIPERLNPQVDGCTKIEGENWPDVIYMTVKTESELRAALADERISEIHLGKNLELTSPISFNARKDLFLSEYTLSINDNFNWGDSDAAIIINAPDDSRKVGTRIEGTHRKSTLNGPKTEYKGKYIIKCNGYFELYNFILNTNGVEHAIKVEDCKFDLTGDVYTYAPTINVTSKTGYALDVYANTKDALVTLNSNGTINGNIRYTKNCNTTSTKSNIDVVKGNIIGDLILNGNYKDLIKVNVGETEPNGKGWPKPGQGGGETPEVKNVIIENVGLSAAIMAEIDKGDLKLPGKVALNGNKYAVMTQEVANAVTALEFLYNEPYVIEYLSGIENFKNLRSVVCVNKGLKEADLNKNTFLTEVNVMHNTDLTKLEISNLVNLKILKYSETAVSTLNISTKAIPYITDLYYGKLEDGPDVYVPNVNEFESLDVLSCYGYPFSLTNSDIKERLVGLHCYNCDISSLDLTEYPKLYSLTCYQNNLKELIIPDNCKIGDLNCHTNNLTNLDVSLLGDQLLSLKCGQQKSGNMQLKLTANQMNKWKSDWFPNGYGLNDNVTPSLVGGQQGGGDKPQGGNTNGNNFWFEEF